MIFNNKDAGMIKLKLKLQGDAEKQFQEMMHWSNANEEKIVLDALNLLHHIMQETSLGKLGGVLHQHHDTIIQPHPVALWNITEFTPCPKCSKQKK